MRSDGINKRMPLIAARNVSHQLMVPGILFIFLCAWHWRVVGQVSISAFSAIVLFVTLLMAYGRIFSILISKIFKSSAEPLFEILTGFFAFNTLLFILSLCLPWGMGVNIFLLTLVALIGFIILQKSAVPSESSAGSMDKHAPIVALIIAGIGASIWCSDIQAPRQIVQGATIFKAWPDIFIHVREISVFSQARGLDTIHDIKLAGGKAPLYHFMSYLSPAALSYLSSTSAMDVYASFQLPFGILLTGLAAYCLSSRWFGVWAGVAAVVAIALIPDAYQQGFGQRYLSYSFLAHVNLGLLYGIACAALAWLFVLDGCRNGNQYAVFLGYGFLAICLFYKAHIFVANSYLLMIYPIIFFKPLRTPWRFILGIGATLAFVVIVSYSQTIPRVPILRLDGSGIGTYLVKLLRYSDPGILKSFFTNIFIEENHNKIVQLAFAMSMLLISTFGFWLVVLAAAWVCVGNTIPPSLKYFPALVILNYLLMATGLAQDSRSVGTPDELLNRPLVWAYFVVSIWSAGMLYHSLLGNSLPRRQLASLSLAASIILAACWAAFSAPNLQTFPGLAGYESFREGSGAPVCLTEAAEHLRRNSNPGDLIQDSIHDPKFVLTALSERQLYVGALGFGGENAEQTGRINAINDFMQMRETVEIKNFAVQNNIQWFLLHPHTSVSWPSEFTKRAVFECGGYRLYHFTEGSLQAGL